LILIIVFNNACSYLITDYVDSEGKSCVTLFENNNVLIDVQYMGTNSSFMSREVGDKLEYNIQTVIGFYVRPHGEVPLIVTIEKCKVEIKDEYGNIIPYTSIEVENMLFDTLSYRNEEEFLKTKPNYQEGSSYEIYYLYGEDVKSTKVSFSLSMTVNINGKRKDYTLNKILEKRQHKEPWRLLR
jgi:hypothetical protein